MRIKTRLRPFIYMDDVRHEIISQRGTVGVLIGAKIGNTGYCVIAVQKDPVGSYKQFVRINDNSEKWRPVSYSFWNHKIPPIGGIFLNFLQIHSIQKIADIVTIIEKRKIFDAGKFFFDNMMHKSYEWIVKMINIEQSNWLVKLSNLLEC